jgi:large subunit ribosomal protein L3
MAALLGRKLGMTQVFDDAGNVVPVTVLEAGPCVVVGVRTPAREGYAAVQLGFDEVAEAKLPKPLRGVFARKGLRPHRVIREVPLAQGEQFEVGQSVTSAAFARGDRVDIVGITKGKGFSGGIKRHNFDAQRTSHGNSLMHRAIGSIGQSNIARVMKGKRMPGRLGGTRSTVRGLRVVSVDPERNLLLIRGAVPGHAGSLVMIRKTGAAPA